MVQLTIVDGPYKYMKCKVFPYMLHAILYHFYLIYMYMSIYNLNLDIFVSPTVDHIYYTLNKA